MSKKHIIGYWSVRLELTAVCQAEKSAGNGVANQRQISSHCHKGFIRMNVISNARQAAMATGDTSSDISNKTKKDILDWDALRQLSLRPNGFGDDRVDIWPKLLNVSKDNSLSNYEEKKDHEMLSKAEESHQDERQISLDTDRSFVLYPGYHDIATVIFLTLPPELHLACVEKLSLHRLRDSMGSGLEPVLGLLRVTKNLLRLADPEYASLLEANAQLPFYALSNLLTLFSHDMPTLPLIQHVFDYLLCRPPIAVVYLATVLILVRKQEAVKLAEEDEEGMIHSLLSSLPALHDDPSCMEESLYDNTKPRKRQNTEPPEEEPSFFKEEPEGADKSLLSALDAKDTVPVETMQSTDIPGDDESKATDFDPVPGYDDQKGVDSVKLEDVSPPSLNENMGEADKEQITHPMPSSLEHSPPEASLLSEPKEDPPEEGSTQYREPLLKPTHLFLTDLLKQADELFTKFPPDHAALSLSSIMGPQSVVFTWSERSSALPSDNTAESMVSRPELVVYPYIPEPDTTQGISKEVTDKGKEDRRRRNKLKKSPFGQMERKTMLAGTVLVLGVAMAVYGIKARNASGHPLFVEGHVHPTTKDWKRFSGWIGGAVIGVSSKLLGGMSSDS
ncbi:hypothetical protein CVT24_000019 [Panaeolus cyanescens]|uniref:Rab-GAP TBC domain-containing protein n=1 Tax=Panaeolus cyanescens TaxID=181874 RepID=A0A409VSH7_9AGAR|nr:hypothetical protein CVT24_000019 [Panaeolus cyanescens]